MQVLIELPTWMGDCMMATPAIENIVDFLDDVEITFIGSSVSIGVMKYHSKVVKTVVFEKNYSALYKTAKKLGDFDVFFSFRSSLRSKFFKFSVLAKNKYQFDKNKYPNLHQVEKYNGFVNDSLKINYLAGSLAPHLKHSVLNIKNSSTQLLGINPGASYGSAKRWEPKKFAKVACALSRQYDIIIFGDTKELDFADDIEKEMIKRNIKNYKNLAGKTSITDLIKCISTLDLFITGDSGPMHVAAAFQVPTVAIFGPTNHNETSQWMNKKSIIAKKEFDCQPCMKRSCPLSHHNCMRSIVADDVLIAVKQLSL